VDAASNLVHFRRHKSGQAVGSCDSQVGVVIGRGN
jgi:hypothetical protein